MAIRPDCRHVIEQLREMNVRVSISTRNCRPAVDLFLRRLRDEEQLEQLEQEQEESNSGGSGSEQKRSGSEQRCQQDWADVFWPVVTRDTLGGINKPDPQVAHHILGMLCFAFCLVLYRIYAVFLSLLLYVLHCNTIHYTFLSLIPLIHWNELNEIFPI
jgi:hypothetical protein